MLRDPGEKAAGASGYKEDLGGVPHMGWGIGGGAKISHSTQAMTIFDPVFFSTLEISISHFRVWEREACPGPTTGDAGSGNVGSTSAPDPPRPTRPRLPLEGSDVFTLGLQVPIGISEVLEPRRSGFPTPRIFTLFHLVRVSKLFVAFGTPK